MDKPRHPLVTRPWKTQQAQPPKWNLPSVKTEKEWRPGWKKKRVLTSKKIRERGSGKTV